MIEPRRPIKVVSGNDSQVKVATVEPCQGLGTGIMSNTSLSSVVSNLVRASMGASVSNNVKDEDLDRHIADLILKEAKQKAERYGSEGVGAYLPQNDW